MADARLTMAEIDGLDRAAFVAALGHVFEESPWVADGAWPTRPFGGVTRLHQALCAVMDSAPVERQVALIRAHPDLVGRAARAGTLTPASRDEQSSAGLDRLSPAEIATFDRLNTAYRDRFGFPFVICVRENRKAGILAGFEARLSHTRDEEIAAARAEIARIAWLRLKDIVRDDGIALAHGE